MEAIKCPNCGSEKVKELTEEKYVCLGCDNIFLVHNLSKEFRQTDAHITSVHEDISKKLDNLNVGMQSVSIQANGDMAKAKIALNEAEEALTRGNFLKAYEEFKKYSLYVPDSYVGYEGMFRALTSDYMDDAGQYKRIPTGMTEVTVKKLLADGTDVLSKALQCEDCDKESILNKYKTYYEKSLDTLKKRLAYSSNPNDMAIISNLGQMKENVIEVIHAEIAQCEKEIEQTNISITADKELVQSSKDNVAQFNALSETEKAAIMKGKKVKAGITFAVVLAIAIFLWGKVGLFLHIIEVIVVLVTGFLCWGSTAEPSVYDSNASVLEEKLKVQKEKLQALQERLAETDSTDDKRIQINAEEIEEFIKKNHTNAHSAQDLYEKYLELENPYEKTGYDVTLLGIGKKVNEYSLSEGIQNRGGYKYRKFPQLIMTKATKGKADALTKYCNSNENVNISMELADNEEYTLLLEYRECEWFKVDKKRYYAIVHEIVGEDVDYAYYDEGHYGSDKGSRIIKRSKDKRMLLDYAKRLEETKVVVKVV